MKKSFLLLIAAVALLMLYATFQIFPFSELLEILLNIPVQLFAAYIGVSMLIFALLVLRWRTINKQHGIYIPYSTLFAYRCAGFAVSFITPGPRVGGEPVRAALMTRNNVDMPHAMSSVIADKTNELLSFGTMFIIALLVTLIISPLPRTVQLVFGIIALFMLFLVTYAIIHILRGDDPVLKIFKLFRLHKIRALKKYEGSLQKFEKSIHGFYGDKPLYFWKAFAYSSVAWAVSLIEFYLVLLMIGVEPTLPYIFLVYTLVGAAYMLPIPLALGTLEAGQTGLFIALGLAAAGGAAVAMITRARDLMWTTIGFIVLGYYGIKKK